MAKVHVISPNGTLYPLAYRLALEGCEVGYFTSPTYKEINVWRSQDEENSNPFISFSPPTEAADFYLLDVRGDGRFGNVLVRERKVLLGGCRLTQRCTNDEEYRTKLVEGLLPSQGEETNELLPIVGFGMFDGEKWLEPQGVAFYQSRLMEGERGPHLGISGIMLKQAGDRLTSAITSPPLADFLSHASYRGFVHLHMRIGPEALFFDDIDFSLTSPTLFLLRELVRGPLYETLFNLSTGLLKHLSWRDDVATGVKLSFTPTKEDVVGELLSPSDYKHLWPDIGVIPPFINLAWVTARGQDVVEARRRVCRTVNMLQPHRSVIWRRDVVRETEAQMEKVKQWGWM